MIKKIIFTKKGQLKMARLLRHLIWMTAPIIIIINATQNYLNHLTHHYFMVTFNFKNLWQKKYK